MSKINSDKAHQAKYGTISKVTAYPALTINEEFASLIPPLSDSDYDALKLSINQNGQHHPIVINQDGIILDGHHRFRACEELKIESMVTRREFKDSLLAKQFIIETNCIRRHLATFQRVELQVKLEAIESELAKKRLVEAGKMGAERRWKKGEANCANRNDDDRVGSKDPTLSYKLMQDEKGRVIDIAAKKAGVSARLYREGREIIRQAPSHEIIDGLRKQKLKIHNVFRQLEDQKKRAEIVSKAKNCNSFLPEGVKLIHADLVEGSKEIPDKVDLMFTDPPYQRVALPIYDELGKAAAMLLKDGGSLVLYCAQDLKLQVIEFMKSKGLTYWWEIAVLHAGPFARLHSKRIIITWKPLLWFTKGNPSKRLPYLRDSIISQTPDKTLHNSAQSTVEAEHVIAGLTFEGDLVLDPFMGSGTTGVAAVNLKRKFIGIDMNWECVQISKVRIATLRSHDNTTVHEP